MTVRTRNGCPGTRCSSSERESPGGPGRAWRTRALTLLICCLLVCVSARAEHYAILYNGGVSTEENEWYYYENTRSMYQTLVNRWDWDPHNITVIASDGLNPADDYDDYWMIYQNSNWSSATAAGSMLLPATKPNLENTIKNLNLGPEDLFFSFRGGSRRRGPGSDDDFRRGVHLRMGQR